MHVLILGASGRTGRLVTAEALKCGHTVTALVRKSSSMEPREGLTIIEGTPTRRSDIEKCFESPVGKPNAAIDVLAAPRATDSPFAKPIVPRFFLRDCIRNLTAVMKAKGVEKLIVMSSFGVGTSFEYTAWPLRLLFRYSNMATQFEDHDAVDADIQALDDFEWTLVRPPMLKDGDAKPVEEFGEFGKGLSMMSSCTRASVAEFLVGSINESTRGRKVIVISN